MSKPIDKQYLIDNMKTFKSVILDPAYLIQKQVLPAATADNEGVVYQYIGSDNVNYTIGGFYQSTEVTPATTPKTYFWNEITTRTLSDGVTILENSNKEIYVPKATDTALGVVKAGDGIDVDSDGVISVVARLEEIDELPTAAAALEGKIYLLTATQTGYDRGGIYMCEESTETAGTYEWKLISMSPLEAGKGITIEDDVISADTNIFPGTLDEWNALTPAEQALYDFVASPDEADGGRDIYSTTETKTNKVWIDGKPIYRKVVSYGALPNGRKDVNHGITNLKKVVNCSAIAIVSSSNLSLPLSFADPASVTNSICVYVSSTNVTIDTGTTDRSNYDTCYVTIEYTKTTD